MTSNEQQVSTVELAGVRTAFASKGNGPLLILCHGAEADHTMFNGMMDALAKDFTVMAYDQRDSGKTENGDATYTLNELADDAANLIKHLGAERRVARAHVFGTSLGGQIAQLVATRHPEVVDRLVLSSTWRVGRPVPEFNPAVVSELLPLRANVEANAEAIAAWFFTRQYLQFRPGVVEMFRRSTRTQAQQQRRGQMQAASVAAPDLKKIEASTLLLAGDADRLIPAAATFELAQHIPNTREVTLPGVPHVGAVESPQLIVDAVRSFLLS